MALGRGLTASWAYHTREREILQQFPPSPKTSIESPQPDARTAEKTAKSRLHDRVRSVGGNCRRYLARISSGGQSSRCARSVLFIGGPGMPNGVYPTR